MSTESEAARNGQAEAIFQNWNLTFRFEPAFPIDQIQEVASQQVRDQANRANSQFVEEYFQQFSAGAVFPAIVLGSNASMIDGNTRLAMWRRAKLKTVPAYLVELPSADLARALGAQLNQIAGVRLTPDESARQAIAMLAEGIFDEQQIARIVGRSRTQVTRWKQDQVNEAVPSYHDLHITTATIERTSIFDLPYGYEVTCTRVGGWTLNAKGRVVAGEYDQGLRLDVAGHVLCDSLKDDEEESCVREVRASYRVISRTSTWGNA